MVAGTLALEATASDLALAQAELAFVDSLVEVDHKLLLKAVSGIIQVDLPSLEWLHRRL